MSKNSRKNISFANFLAFMRILYRMNGPDAMESLSDAELVRRAQTSQADFTLLVDRYWRRLYAFVKRLYFFEHEDIQDIVQEAFIKIYRNLNAFDPSFAFSTWAYQITRNCAIDMLRKKQVQPKTIILEDEEWEHLVTASDEPAMRSSQREDLEKAIKQLPLVYREVFTLFYLEEKSYEEMIDILKKPKGTIASLLNRAKKMVREQLEKHPSNV